MISIAQSLRAQYPRDKLYLLVAKRNSGSFTYDGVELGGERVCHEIEEELEAIKNRGGKITKLSIVGYSLGGLVARYAIGLLFARGVLDNLECMNFTAFASPFLGVRSPRRGALSRIFNVLGADIISIRAAAIWCRQVPRHRQTACCRLGGPKIHIHVRPGQVQPSYPLRKCRERQDRRLLYHEYIQDGPLYRPGEHQDQLRGRLQ